jgi:hypothetical protein
VLAIFSWKHVETPFRKRVIFESRFQLFSLAVLSTVLAISLGLCIKSENGVASRFSEQALRYADGRNDHFFRRGTTLDEAVAGKFVVIGSDEDKRPIEFLIWGDSHAMGMTRALDELGKTFQSKGIQACQHGTPPIIDSIDLEGSSDTKTFANAVLSFITNSEIKNVIITAHWKHYARDDAFGDALISTVSRVLSTGVKVFVARDVPDHGFDVPRICALNEMYGKDPEELGISLDRHRAANKSIEEIFGEIEKRGATVLDPAKHFVTDKAICRVVSSGWALYTDGNHLSNKGADLLVPLFKPIFVNAE